MAEDSPTRRDLLQIIARLREEIRQLRARRKGHTESKTFIVGGTIPIGLSVPPFFVAIDGDGDTPEWKRLIGFRAVLASGTAELHWLYNGTALLDPDGSTLEQSVDTDPTTDPITLPQPIDLRMGDTIAPFVNNATDAVDLAAAAFMVTAAG